MVDFINEVEEELRKDKYNKLLRKYGPYIVAAIFVIVAATGYMEYNKSKTANTAEAASAAYMTAGKLETEGDLQGAINKFVGLAKVAPNGYAGLSLTRAAGMKVQLGDLTGAVSLFDRAADKFEKPIHKDLASLKAVYILLDQGRYDDVQARAGLLAVDGAPFADLAKEVLAHAALKSGDVGTARTQFTYLSNAPGVLVGVKTRATQSLALINASRPVIKLDSGVVGGDLPAPKLDGPELDEPEPETPMPDTKDKQE